MTSINISTTEQKRPNADDGTIVFLHSSLGSGQQWAQAFTHFSKNYHVIAPDLYGYGSMDPWNQARGLTLDDELEIVQTIFGKLNHPVHLVGHSYGGAIALHAALKFPEKIKSLCLIEPVAFHLLFPKTKNRDQLAQEISSLVFKIGDALTTGFPLLAARLFINYWNGEGCWANISFPQKVILSKMMPKVLQDFHATLTEPTQPIAYMDIKLPTTILSGSISPEPTRDIAQKLRHLIPDARQQQLTGAGHMLPLTHWAQTNAAIDAHILRSKDFKESVAA